MSEDPTKRQGLGFTYGVQMVPPTERAAVVAETEAAIVAWLLDQGIASCDMDGWWHTSTGEEYGQSIIDAIERGEYRGEVI